MTFKDIKGQDRAIEIIKGYVREKRLEGGYLFSGPQGVGKKLVAKILAKALNCAHEDSDSCEQCDSCRKIENSQHPDIHVIESQDAEADYGKNSLRINPGEKNFSGIKIEAIRQLQKEISLKPYEGKKEVFIIDNAHTLTQEAQGALLKTLEEPPKDSVIILISDKPQLLFKTIISRCKLVRFLPLKRLQLKQILNKDYGFDNDTAHFLAYFSEGRLGRALSLKDKDILQKKNTVIDKLALCAKPSVESFPMQNKNEVRSYLNILAAWFRDIYLIKIGMPHSELINLDRKEDLLKVMSRFSFLGLDEILSCISDSIWRLEQNINTKLMLYNLGAQLWKA